MLTPQSEISPRESFRGDPKSVVVIGAGISGLCAAYWLKKQGVSVTVLERDAEAGGTMKTIHDGGWLIETGPNSALETTPLFRQLFTDLALDVLYANALASNRYIVHHGTLKPLPTGPGSFLTSGLWSTAGKLRLLKEPFVGRARIEESVSGFVRRRLGKEFLDYAVDPFVAGVYAGNPDTLSVQSALPKIYALEAKYGGLIKGAIQSRRERKKRQEIARDRAKLFSFSKGMQTLPRSLAAFLGDSLTLNASVEHIVPMRAGRHPVYTISYTHEGAKQTIEAAAVVLAAPAYATAGIIDRIDPAMAQELRSIEYAPVAEVFLGFSSGQIGRALDGFGFLVPRVEHRDILGTIWSSTLFPDRAPSGMQALTSFVGGARQPELLAQSDEELIGLVVDGLRSLMGVKGSPAYAKVVRWDRAIPQYTLGYAGKLKAMEMFEMNFRGAFVCSNYKGGISVGDCVMSSEKVAGAVMAHLAL